MPPVASGSKPSTGKLPAIESKMVKAGLQAPKQMITQKELFGSLGLQSNNTTMEAINSLLRKNLMTMLKDSKGEISFKFIAKEEAKALGNMDTEEKLVFDHIKNAGNAGIWTKTLTSSTQLPRTTITKVLKILEGKKTVKTVKSVKAPTRKIYMLANLVPSVELTGGPWFTDNELDVEFVGALKRICHKIIQKESTPKRGGEGKLLPIRITSQLPRVDTIRKFIDGTGVALQVELTDEHVASLLDLMVYEGSIEKIFYPKDADEDAKRLNGKKANGKSRKRPHESDDSDDDRRSKKKGRSKGKAPPKKKKKRVSRDSDSDDDDESDAESEEIDSDEDAEAYRRKKAKLEEEGIETKTSKRKRKKRKAIKNEDSDAGSDSEVSSASSSESESEDDRRKVKPKTKSEEDIEAEKSRLAYVYRLARPYEPVIGWTDIPCGRCPVEQFCSEAPRPLATPQPRANAGGSSGRPKVGISIEGGLQGVGMLGGAGAAIGVSTAKWGEVKGAVGRAVAPVNPKDCKYYQDWFEVEF